MFKLPRGGRPPWAAAVAPRRTAAASGPRAQRWPAGAVSGLDAGIAVLATGVSLASSYAADAWHPHSPPVNLTGIVLLVASGASLAGRHRYPGAVLAMTLAAALAAGPAGHVRLAWPPVIVALFAAVRARRRAAVIAALVIGYLASVWPPWLIGSRGHATATFALGLLCGLLVLLSAAELARAAAQRRLATQRLRELELLRLATEERVRIAGDLHDMVAHNISVINVQANTALYLADRQPERAREALATINEVSRQALAELRSVLGVLRGVGELTQREREVVVLVAEGLSNEQIEDKLSMSRSTAKTHVTRAMTKLGARDRAQLVALAYQADLARPGRSQ